MSFRLSPEVVPVSLLQPVPLKKIMSTSLGEQILGCEGNNWNMETIQRNCSHKGKREMQRHCVLVPFCLK